MNEQLNIGSEWVRVPTHEATMFYWKLQIRFRQAVPKKKATQKG